MPINAQLNQNSALAGMDAVLRAVRLHGAESQADVVKVTGLGRAAVAERVTKLLELGLLDAGGTVIQGRGRPSTRISVRGRAGHVLIAALTAGSIESAIANLAGELVASRTDAIDVSDGPATVLEQIAGRFAALYEECDQEIGALIGVGVGVPGPVEYRTGRPVAPPIMPGWDAFPLADSLRARFGVPVWVDGDVNLVTLAEWRHGVARGHDSVVFLKVGTGIGVGIVMDGGLRRGENGAAGDIGHIQVTDDPSVTCRCGNTGCLEPLAGGFAVAQAGERAVREGRSPLLAGVLGREGALSAAAVGEAAARGDAASIEILQRAGRYAGTMLAGVVNLLNPSLVVIGGGVARSGDVFLAAVRESVYRRSLPLATRHLVVALAEVQDHPALRGAATMALDELCRDANLAEMLERIETARASGRVA